jgi:pimeloyl-ACP methyl ester carboxylesterase
MSGTGFVERFVEADGFRIRYLEAGAADGEPLIVLHGAGGLRHAPAHDLLAERRRVVLFEAPGFGESPANERSGSLEELAGTMLAAVTALGVERFALMGTSFGGKLALWMAVGAPDRVAHLVLAAPAAIRPEGRPRLSPEERRAVLYAHPERLRPPPPPSADVEAKQEALVGRLMGPARDEALEAHLPELQVPTLVVFGTEDRLVPPEMGRHYRELLPSCSLIFVYDAGHVMEEERPEAFTAVVGDFLERGPGFVVKEESGLLFP